MSQSNRRRLLGATILAVACLATSLTGCGPRLDRISELNNLRILGVRKSSPYARPGETVRLQMLWEDGRETIPDKVETFFGFWCLNPPGNSYSQCFTAIPDLEPQFEFGSNEFDLTIPEDSLIENPNLPDAPASGSAFVFYGVCAGSLDVPDLKQSAADPQDLVPRCLDESGEQVDADDFVIGYSQVYIYDELRNENPKITGLMQGEEELKVDCIDGDCDAPYEVPDLKDCEEGVLCLETCEDDGDVVLCEGKSVEVVFDRDSIEKDELASIFGSDLEESIWVSYFIDRGGVSPELKLINEPSEGYISNHSARIYAPKEPGPIRIWAVVRDNRGGIAWLRAPGYVKAKD